MGENQREKERKNTWKFGSRLFSRFITSRFWNIYVRIRATHSKFSITKFPLESPGETVRRRFHSEFQCFVRVYFATLFPGEIVAASYSRSKFISIQLGKFAIYSFRISNLKERSETFSSRVELAPNIGKRFASYSRVSRHNLISFERLCRRRF